METRKSSGIALALPAAAALTAVRGGCTYADAVVILSPEWACKGVRGKVQSRLETGNVVGGNGGAQHGGKVQEGESVLIVKNLELIVVHGAIGSTEIHGAFGDLLNAAAGANRLIVDLKIGVLLVVLVKPLRIHGVRKSGTRTVNRERAFRP